MAQFTGSDASDFDVDQTFSLVADDPADQNNPTPDLNDFESRPIAEIHAELREQGIDPEPTIRAVMALVHEKLHARRSVHLEQIKAELTPVAIAVVIAFRHRRMLRARLFSNGRAVFHPRLS